MIDCTLFLNIAENDNYGNAVKGHLQHQGQWSRVPAAGETIHLDHPPTGQPAGFKVSHVMWLANGHPVLHLGSATVPVMHSLDQADVARDCGFR